MLHKQLHMHDLTGTAQIGVLQGIQALEEGQEGKVRKRAEEQLRHMQFCCRTGDKLV